MPKSAYELKLFSEGIVSHPDPDDININASVYSENLDPLAKDGTLKAKKAHRNVYTFSNSMTSNLIEADHRKEQTSLNHTLAFFQPALGRDGEITSEARVGYIEDIYNLIDN